MSPTAIPDTALGAEADLSFEGMGTGLRLLIGDRLQAGLCPPAEAAERQREWLRDFESRLSRFRPDSELCALNEDGRWRVPASRLLGTAVEAAVAAARLSHGLCDPTLVGEIESAGYRETRHGAEPAPLDRALDAAPPRRPARPRRAPSWRRLRYERAAGVVVRPPGVRIDTGGFGKGLAADLVAARLRGYERYVVDCGGDLRIGGPGAILRPYEVEVAHPGTGERRHTLRIASGAVATSGIGRRVWCRGDGYAHHLLDPSTGEPAWTGLIGATAMAPTGVEAEARAKAAVLSGPEGARRMLERHGGVIVHDDGRSEPIGAAAGGGPPAIRLEGMGVAA